MAFNFASISDPAIRSSTEGTAPSSSGRHGPPAEETGRHPLAVAAYGALWRRGEEDQGYISLAVLFFTSWLWVFDFLWIIQLMWEKIIKKETWLPRAKESNILLRSLAWHEINFPCFLSCLDQNGFRNLFPLLQDQGAKPDSSWSIPVSEWLCLIFPFCSYRTRCWIILNAAAVANSGWWPSSKRRRTTKIRRLIVAWDCRVPSLFLHCVSATSVWSHH